MVTDQFGHLAHLHARDTSFCLVSLAPLKNIEKFKKRMGWTYPWYSSEGTDFNKDFGLTTDKGENYGLSVFIHDGKDVYRTYFTDGRGVEGLNIWTFLDLTPLGRQEEWEDSPAGGPRTKPFVWWRRHDEYGKDTGAAISMSNCPLCNLDQTPQSSATSVSTSSRPTAISVAPAEASNGSSQPLCWC